MVNLNIYKMSNSIKHLSYDIKAGITVFLIAIPLCLGIAFASNAPLISGLVSGIVGGVLVGLLSGSRLSVSGPAAGLVTIVLAALVSLGSFEAFLLCVIFAGVIQLILAFLRMDVFAHYIPNSVIKGMLAGIGAILIAKQIPYAFGYSVEGISNESFIHRDGTNTIDHLYHLFNYISAGAVVISIVSIACILFFETKFVKNNKYLKFLPGSLVAIVIAVLLNSLFGLLSPSIQLVAHQLVSVPELSLDTMHHILIFPDFSQIYNPMVYVYALIIAIVATIETLLSIEAIDKLDHEKRVTPAARELKAQGVGNIVSGFLGGLPITSVIVRSSVNLENNAKSKISTIIHGLLLFAGLLIGTSLMNKIPLASLSVILIYTGYKLVNEKILRQMYHSGVSQLIPFLLTLTFVFLTDILTGVALGLIVSLLFVINRYYNLHKVRVLDKGDEIVMILPSYTTFLSKLVIQKRLVEISEGKNIIFDLSNSKYIDIEIKEVMQDFIVVVEANNKTVNVKDPNNSFCIT